MSGVRGGTPPPPVKSQVASCALSNTDTDTLEKQFDSWGQIASQGLAARPSVKKTFLDPTSPPKLNIQASPVGVKRRFLFLCAYRKTCVKWPLKNRQNKDLNDKR